MSVILEKRTINLALQGGGAHGAFTWGVLDRLLMEPLLDFEGISGTSAGAMNAAMFKTGWVEGKHASARARLDDFWQAICERAAQTAHPVTQWIAMFSPEAALEADRVIRAPALMASDAFSRTFSPYDWNPLNIHPLRDLLNEMAEFDAVCRDCWPLLFVGATNVRTGKIEVFDPKDITVEHILASACLPNLFQAIEIGDGAYWDGGYMGNPALFPLFELGANDIVIVHVNPIERSAVPESAADIQNRINEISFNSSLLRELRAIDFVRKMLADGRLKPGEMKDVLIHSIRDDETMQGLDVQSKVSPAPGLFAQLKEAGQTTADQFLTAHWQDLGKRSSVDLRAMFQ